MKWSEATVHSSESSRFPRCYALEKLYTSGEKGEADVERGASLDSGNAYLYMCVGI